MGLTAGVAGFGLAWGLVASIVAVGLWRQLHQAQDRLYQAASHGAIIPAREEPPLPDPPQTLEAAIREEFPDAIVEWLGQWDTDEAKVKWAARARTLLRKHKQNIQAVLSELDTPVW